MSRNNGHKFRKFAGELIVPLVMVAFLGAYWWQAAGLSAGAISFPLTLTGILVALLLAQLVLVWRERPQPEKQPEYENAALPDDMAPPWTVALRRGGMLALGAGLFLFWRELGGTVVIYVFTLGTLLLLGERRWPILAILPTGLAVVLSYLFKGVLRVRFPDGLLSIF